MRLPALAAAALAVLGSSLLAACTVGPNYARPQMPNPSQYRFFDTASQAESMADAPWWQVFDDPTLQALIREAIANNLDLRAAMARVEEARARAGIAKSFLYPEVNGGAGYRVRGASNTPPQGSQDDPNANDTTQQSAAYGFQLSWEIDLFGRLRRQHEAALALTLATEQARRGVLVTLVGDVASNYFLLRELDLQLDISRRTLDVNDRTITYFQDRLNGGVSNRLELDRNEANRAQTAAAIPDIEHQIGITEDLLSLLVGRPPGTLTRQALPEATPAPPRIPPGVPAALLERRPDVVQAEQVLVAANADIGAAKALFFPTISLTGFLGGVSGDLTQFLGGDGAVWSLAPAVFQPIFQAGRLRHNVDAAKANFDAALARYQQSALNAYREVADALITIQKLSEQRVALERASWHSRTPPISRGPATTLGSRAISRS